MNNNSKIQKIIFLDMDGVMNRRPTRDEVMQIRTKEEAIQFHKEIYGINPKIVPNLKKIIDQTDCKIVVSSTWKVDIDHPIVGDDWRLVLSEYLLMDKKSLFIGNTPYLSVTENRRGLEIKEWIRLNMQPGKFKYCVIDDEISDIIGIIPKNNIVKTNSKYGLTEDDVDKVINILNE